MGAVYEALHEPLSRKVAIKIIRSDLGGQADLMSRFRREAEASAALGHPNIVQVTDFIIEPSRPTPLMVMEYLEGRTLRDLVQTAKKLDPPRAVFIALQILSGLAAAHRAGIIHRDVKPANIFLQKTLAVRDHVKLLDFGLAKLMETSPGDQGDMPVTQRGFVVGTRAYMAPEQEEAGHVDARSDLYAVGATLYYALSGRKPKASREVRTTIPLRKVVAEISPKLAAVVDQALAPRPNDRYASAEKMAEALAEFSGGGAGTGSPTFLPGSIAPAKIDSSTVDAVPLTERDDRFRGRDVIDSLSIKAESQSSPLESTIDDTLKTGRPKFDSQPAVGSDQFVVSTKKMKVPADARARMAAARAEAVAAQAPTAVMTPGVPIVPSHSAAVPPSPESAAQSGMTAFPSVPPARAVGGASKRNMVLLVIAFVALLLATLWGARYFGQ